MCQCVCVQSSHSKYYLRREQAPWTIPHAGVSGTFTVKRPCKAQKLPLSSRQRRSNLMNGVSRPPLPFFFPFSYHSASTVRSQFMSAVTTAAVHSDAGLRVTSDTTVNTSTGIKRRYQIGHGPEGFHHFNSHNYTLM